MMKLIPLLLYDGNWLSQGSTHSYLHSAPMQTTDLNRPVKIPHTKLIFILKVEKEGNHLYFWYLRRQLQPHDTLFTRVPACGGVASVNSHRKRATLLPSKTHSYISYYPRRPVDQGRN